MGTSGTADYINKHGIKCKKINKVNQGSPHIVDVLNAKDSFSNKILGVEVTVRNKLVML